MNTRLLTCVPMPTYEFRCESGHATDQFFRSINSAPSVIECPECGESAVRQVSGGAGLLFKGSGFYITDYARKPQKESDSGSQAAEPKAESKPEAKPDTGTSSSTKKSSD